MAEVEDRKRCRAIAGDSRKQCKNRKLRGSPYCWHHQPWKTTLIGFFISLLIGALSGFVINVLSAKYTERAPKLEPYLNLERLADDTVFVYPTNSTYPSNAPWCELTFSVRNRGNMDATEMFLRLTTHSYVSNSVHAPKWRVEEVADFVHTDERLAALVQRGDRPIPPMFSAKFQPLLINSGKIQCFGGQITYGAIGAETKIARIHIIFDNPAGVTNVFRDKVARAYLSRIDAGNALRSDTFTMKFILDSTDDMERFQKDNPWVRTEVVTDETNAEGKTYFKTNVLR